MTTPEMTITNPGRQPFRLTPEQYVLLTKALDEGRVGKNPKGFSHLEAWDVRRWLIRIFGFGGYEVENQVDLVKEIEHPVRRRKNKEGVEYGEPYSPWTVVYRSQTRLTVFDQFGGSATFEDGACGDSANQPSLGDAHDNAMKTALSQALKRCAVNLGDQFGLGLYNNGKTTPVVLRSMVAPSAPSAAAPEAVLPVDEPVQPEPGTAPVVDDHAATAAADPPAPQAKPVQTDLQRAKALREWALKSQRRPDEIRSALAKLRAEHPTTATTEVVNEHGEEEQLADLMERRAREGMPGGAAQEVRLQTRTKRMFALLNELGFGGDKQRGNRLKLYANVLGREVGSTNDLSLQDIETLIAVFETKQQELAAQQREAVPA